MRKPTQMAREIEISQSSRVYDRRDAKSLKTRADIIFRDRRIEAFLPKARFLNTRKNLCARSNVHKVYAASAALRDVQYLQRIYENLNTYYTNFLGRAIFTRIRNVGT